MSSVLLILLLAQWPQFGGPNRNFQVDAPPLASAWPAEGPKKLWTRELGAGFSGIAVSDGRLFTMYNRGGLGSNGVEEVIVAIDQATGKTIWEYSYRALFKVDADVGPGPHATPLVDGDRVYTTGATGKFLCLDAKTGKVLWMHDLKVEYNSSPLIYGYASSPLLYKDKIILPVGGNGYALMAFDKTNGRPVWRSGSFTNAYSSPLAINVDGQDQIVVVMKQDIVAIDPNTSNLLWWRPQKAEYGLNVTMPVWGPDNLLFISSAYNGGSQVLRLHQSGGKTTIDQLWTSYKMHVHHSNVVRIGDMIVGSNGDFGPAPLTAVDVTTGKVLWQTRDFPKVNILVADHKAILLDEDGLLALATLSPDGCKVLSKAQLLDKLSWTAPALAGTKLYVRDKKEIAAFDLK
jgi:outer membrane protein assembly factor BamB